MAGGHTQHLYFSELKNSHRAVWKATSVFWRVTLSLLEDITGTPGSHGAPPSKMKAGQCHHPNPTHFHDIYRFVPPAGLRNPLNKIIIILTKGQTHWFFNWRWRGRTMKFYGSPSWEGWKKSSRIKIIKLIKSYPDKYSSFFFLGRKEK